MANLWPWLAVAGAGALHGLNPASGWLFAAARGLRSRDALQALRTLAPIGIGQAVSVAVVAAGAAHGLVIGRAAACALVGALLVAAAVRHRLRAPAGHAAVALCSFVTATVHGAGLMLVPALVPLCMADSPAREITASGSLGPALAAVGVHTAAMLVTSGIAAAGVCRVVAVWPGRRP